MELSKERRDQIRHKLDIENSFRDALAFCNFSQDELRYLLSCADAIDEARKLPDGWRNPNPKQYPEGMEAEDCADELDRAIRGAEQEGI